jgi:hypothetical protein
MTIKWAPGGFAHLVSGFVAALGRTNASFARTPDAIAVDRIQEDARRRGKSLGLRMGLFSFLTGGKKKAAKVEAGPAPAPAVAPTAAEKKAEAALAKAATIAAPVMPPAAVLPPTGITQAKLRLRLAASLRAGQAGAAYAAAKELADIQAKAGRRVGARIWATEAARIKSGIPG